MLPAEPILNDAEGLPPWLGEVLLGDNSYIADQRVALRALFLNYQRSHTHIYRCETLAPFFGILSMLLDRI